MKAISAHTGKVSANPVSSVVPTERHGERHEMQIFSSAIRHVGLIENKNLLQEGWKKTTTDTRISAADNTHAFITSQYFLFFLTVSPSGVKQWCKNVKFAFPFSTSPIFFRFTGGPTNKSKAQRVYFFYTRLMIFEC